MLQVTPAQTGKQQAFVYRRRFEFFGALIVAGIVPWAGLRWIITDTTFSVNAYHNALIANGLAIVMALWIRISVSNFQ